MDGWLVLSRRTRISLSRKRKKTRLLVGDRVGVGSGCKTDYRLVVDKDSETETDSIF